ncbi:MAG TPA: carboxypeptidase-like regulatory domain-containing protein [Methylomirabilota bacterium]|nr:carboxypeptidase-like regulatory domain-containing protein [Methylomirabilota bacterium]
MKRRAFVVGVTSWIGAAVLPAVSEARTAIIGIVRSKAGQPLAGLVLLEKGEIHNNVWHGGALVDATGRFRIELAAGGQYGVHVYASGYIYSPQAVQVEHDKTWELSVTLVPEPTRANDPVIKRAGFFPWEARQGKVTFVKLEVGDPNGDLGPQVMALNAATGHAYAMQPPRRVRDLKANFPPGVYQIEIDTSRGPVNPRDWHFVVADHQCNTTDILSFPHEPRPPQIVR